MTRRRKITIISLATAGVVLVAAGTATATALILGDDPALQPEPQPVAATPSAAAATDTRGELACKRLFTNGSLDIASVNNAMERVDLEGVQDWLQDVYSAAGVAKFARTDAVKDAAGEVETIIEDGNAEIESTGNVVPLADMIVDLTAMPEPPLLVFATACTDADLVEQELVDQWADTLAGQS